jgi:acyl-CoA synthetase (NDP forming)
MMFGLGGIFVEVMRDVAVQLHPLTDLSARQMIERIEGYPILAGARGERPVDLDLVASCLLRLSQLVADLEDEMDEIDVNPLIVTEHRNGSFVVDARMALTARD